jgi:hypothetical protein
MEIGGRTLRYTLKLLHGLGLISPAAWTHAWEASHGFRIKVQDET